MPCNPIILRYWRRTHSLLPIQNVKQATLAQTSRTNREREGLGLRCAALDFCGYFLHFRLFFWKKIHCVTKQNILIDFFKFKSGGSSHLVMDVPHHGYRATAKSRARTAPPAGGNPLLFEDTSSPSPPMARHGYYMSGAAGAGAGGGGDGGTLFRDPVASAAMMYGSSLAFQGKDMVNKEISRFVSMNKLKYFFAVDTKYVLKKLLLLLFPYAHQDWEVRYHRDTPLTPRHDVNAPDLYIPSMAFLTYILLTGMALGMQRRFSPEVLGLCASTALVWVIIEVVALMLGLYVLSVHSDLSTFDLLAFSGYKYVGMIFAMLGGLMFGRNGYFLSLAWASCALMYFIVRSLRMKILSSLSSDSMGPGASARPQLRLYITMATATFQPIIIYWLTSHLVR
ncbi:hypothetical protein AAFF_G00291280 [Aldrovandia affinis]|uniref:Protein YIF1 n=1 Tax=Aldrovandia affinis TaxID=143900 RepID=A0AAD7W1J6_9TELE|nr:hypothetical protein AAFF_G00291280 [Aldrovandia affinis]